MIYSEEHNGSLQRICRIKKAYETGRGRAVLRSKTKIEDIRGNKQQIIVTEIPYEGNKLAFVKPANHFSIYR